MKFYIAGRQIRDISELESGKLYSVCGVAGKIKKINEPTGETYCVRSEGERLMLAIGRDELLDRIHLGMVYVIKREFKPREKTMAKLYSCIKK